MSMGVARSCATRSGNSCPNLVGIPRGWLVGLLLALGLLGRSDLTSEEPWGRDSELIRAERWLGERLDFPPPVPRPRPVPTQEVPWDAPGVELGSWIWHPQTHRDQTVFFRREVEIRSDVPVFSARVRMTADNAFVLYVDGEPVGWGDEWPELQEFDLTGHVGPGRRVLTVAALNHSHFAGMIFGLRVEYSDGRVLQLGSDRGWSVRTNAPPDWPLAPTETPGWGPAQEMGAVGAMPWMVPGREIPPLDILFSTHPRLKRRLQWAWPAALAAGAVGIWWGRRSLRERLRIWLERERGRIAQDLHDELGAGLTQLSLLGERAQREAVSAVELRQQVAGITRLSRGLQASLDAILWRVHPQHDTVASLGSYLCQYATEFLEPTGLRLRLAVPTNLPAEPLAPELRHHLFLATKEALNNVVKHANAQRVTLTFEAAGGRLRVTVTDDGQGFDPGSVTPGRRGLESLDGRLRQVGGTAEVQSGPGEGCTVRLSVPLRPPSPGGWRRRSAQPVVGTPAIPVSP